MVKRGWGLSDGGSVSELGIFYWSLKMDLALLSHQGISYFVSISSHRVSGVPISIGKCFCGAIS